MKTTILYNENIVGGFKYQNAHEIKYKVFKNEEIASFANRIQLLKVKQEPTNDRDDPTDISNSAECVAERSDKDIKNEIEYNDVAERYGKGIKIEIDYNSDCNDKESTTKLHSSVKEEIETKAELSDSADDVLGSNDHEVSKHSSLNNSLPHLKIKLHRCTKCSNAYSKLFRLKRHVQSAHGPSNMFRCKKCSNAYSKSCHLERHVQSAHDPSKLFRCKKCSNAYSNSFHLERHVQSAHDPSKLFRCKKCKHDFTRKDCLTRHMSFNCTKMKSYKGRRRRLTGNRKNMCSQCDAKFKTAADMKVHCLKHEREKPFQCKLCERRYRFKGNLKDHLKIHAGITAYKCAVCDKGFTREDFLIRHILSHTSIKEHKCSICTKAYKLSEHLKRHMMKHSKTVVMLTKE